MRNLVVKRGAISDGAHTLRALAAMRRGLPDSQIASVVERDFPEILEDNPLPDRLIEVQTKAMRRGLMSGETLRAPRQQLRLLRASAFDLALNFQLLSKSATVARLSGARRIFGSESTGFREPAGRFLLHKKLWTLMLRTGGTHDGSFAAPARRIAARELVTIG